MKNKLIRLFLFVVIFLVFAQCIYLWQEKQLLQTALIERVKAISLYEQFTREVLVYLSQSKKRDKQLQKNIQEFLDYMAVYSTEEQKGSSRKFMEEVRENLKKQILKQMENEKTLQNEEGIKSQQAP